MEDFTCSLNIPFQHYVLLSFEHFDFLNKTNSVYGALLWILIDDKIQRVYYNYPGLPEYYHGKVLKIVYNRKIDSDLYSTIYTRNHRVISTGFKAKFSFVLPSQKITKNKENPFFFDCSGPNYKYFQDHVMCNLKRECAGFEDEWNCTFSSLGCKGDISIGQSCYALFHSLEVRRTTLTCLLFVTLKAI